METKVRMMNVKTMIEVKKTRRLGIVLVHVNLGQESGGHLLLGENKTETDTPISRGFK